MKPPTFYWFPRSVAAGALTGYVFAMLIITIEDHTGHYINVWLQTVMQLAVTMATTMGVAYLLVQRYQRRSAPRPLIAPVDVDSESELMRHVFAQSWNTGNSAAGYYDENGKMHIADRPPIRIPITRHDADGTVIDGTAATRIVVAADETLKVGVDLYDIRDLDGNELVLPPQSKFETTIDERELFGNLFGEQ